MKLRAADPEDAPACVAILRGWIAETPWMPALHTKRSMESFWCPRLASCPACVLDNGRGVQGFAVREAHTLSALYLAPEARGKGNGRRLLEAASDGIPMLQLWVFQANAPARRFYEAAGFHETHRTAGDNEEGLPDILMQRRAYSAAN